ncbi:WhiB family transcriptional regulator [Kitasatospora sp. NPDC052868]|uniref:WhiB family transcriptional regulator n=1 Tax=Kitasatospora sp. NPDC052868 TaxID=3364060 RepID=UPI0037C55201
MTHRHTLPFVGTRAPHRAARPAATVLAEVAPAAGGDLRGAACTGADPDLFFPDDDTGKDVDGWAGRRAKMICAGCPVQSLCLGMALERREPYGIFGGLNAGERRALHRRTTRAGSGGVA